METVIKVENLSKRYRLGLKEKEAETLVEQVGEILKSPWKNFKKLRELNRFGIEDDSVFWALEDVSFEVKEGEVLGIIGKNGAGKSTLLKILSQITEPTSGKIEIFGRVASLLEVGTGFHPELSGRENIYMNGTILGMTKREINTKLEEIIDFSGVEKFIDTPVKFYSSGMKVRLGFSVAAHLEPEILIIDEVLSVGDFEFQKKCLGKMEDVSKNQGRTVIFVSHDLTAVSSLCKTGLLLEKSKVKSIGPVGNVLSSYRYQQGDKHKDKLSLFNEQNGFIWKDFTFSQSETEKMLFVSGEKIFIEVQYEIIREITGFRIYVDVLDSNFNLISRNFFDENNFHGSTIGQGNYSTILEIPENILVQGSYYVKIRACQHNKFDYEPTEGFMEKIDIFESGKFTRKEFGLQYRGDIILPIKWNTKNV